MTDNWGLLGNEWAVEMLRRHIARDGVRHAYLFTGAPGLGRRTLALRFIQALNCPQPAAAGEACRSCRTCRQIEAMQYSDLAVIQAEKEGGTLKVEQIRAAQYSLSLAPYQGRVRTALFLRFQEANHNAENALLKTLEEAPPQVILLLTADNADLLLPTIVSRCEIMRLRPVPVELVQEYLQARGADETTARLLAGISGGRPGYALRLMADPDMLDFRARRLDDLQELITANRRTRFAYAEKMWKDKEKEVFRNVFLLWLAYWRDVMLCAAKAGTPIANVDRSDEIRNLASRLTLPTARRLVSNLENALDRLDKNVNSRLLAEVVLMDWPGL